MSEALQLGAPPDGVALASLDARRDWLADPRITAVLPREGVLWLPHGRDGGWVSLTATTLATGSQLPTADRTVALAPALLAPLQRAWRASWTWEDATPTNPSDEAEASQFLLLHWRGVFAVRAGDTFGAGLAAAIADAAAR